MTTQILQCLNCKHYIGKLAGNTKPICKAFPEGIPDDLLYNKVEHTKPYKGDNGTRFTSNT